MLNTTTLQESDIRFRCFTAPLLPGIVRETESLLLQIFEYGDYSFRSALSGEYSQTLACVFFTAEHKGKTIGAAGCLYAHENPAVSILGPVGVADGYRGKGIGTGLVGCVVDFLKERGGEAIYLGVLRTSRAVNLYRRLGFEKYTGIVMRRLFCSAQKFEKNCFGRTNNVKIRRAVHGDLPQILALASFPCSIYTFDFRRSIFSSKYIEPVRFLSLFGEIVEGYIKQGFANVLVCGRPERVVGVAYVSVPANEARKHIAELDFYIHDNFIDWAETLVSTTIKESVNLSIDKINCYCPACDHIKQNVLLSLGAEKIAVLPDNIRLNDNYIDVHIYELKGHSGAVYSL